MTETKPFIKALPDDLVDLIIKTGKIKTAKNEEFIEHNYIGLPIVYRMKDMYVNAGKLCVSQGADFKILMRTKFWKEELLPSYEKQIKEMKTNCLTDDNKQPILMYYLNPGYQEFQGYYVHPKLVHGIANWCSVSYEINVSHHMDLINEELIRKNSTIEQKIKNQEETIKALRKEYEHKISELEGTIDRYNEGRVKIEGEIEIRPTKKQNVYEVHSNQFTTINHNPSYNYVNTFNPDYVFYTFKLYVSRKFNKKVSMYASSSNKVEGNIEDIIDMLECIKSNTFKINLPLKEINEREKEQVELYNNKADIIGKLFEIHCSNKHNIPLFKYGNPEKIGLNHKDVGIDLIDIENKITGQCKCYGGYITSLVLESYFKCVEYINSKFEGWTHNLYILETTILPKSLKQQIESLGINIVREEYETESSMKIKRKNEVLEKFVVTNIKTIEIQIGNISYYPVSELMKLCDKHNQKYRCVTKYLTENNFINKRIQNSLLNGSYWFKESETVQQNKLTLKDELNKLITPYNIYDVIKTKDISCLGKELDISTRSTCMTNTLKEMGFVSSAHDTKQIGGWFRVNKEKEERLNIFLASELDNVKHVSVEQKIEYYSMAEIKKYCEDNNIPFDEKTIEKYFRDNGINHSNKYDLITRNKNRWVWVKSLK